MEITQDGEYIYIEHYDGGSLIVTGTGCCIETFKEGNTVYVSGTCKTATGTNIGDGIDLLSGITGYDCYNDFQFRGLSGAGCISTYLSDDETTVYISGTTKNFTGNWPSTQETGINSLNSNQKIETNLLYGVYDITGEGGAATCEKYLDLVSVTGTGCIETSIRLDEVGDGTFRSTLYISGMNKGVTGNWPMPQVTGIDSLNSNQKIDTNLLWGVYNLTGSAGIADGCDPNHYLDLVSVTGTGCIETSIRLDEVGDGTFRSTLYISGTTSITGQNIGEGAGVLSGITGDDCAYDFQFKTITGGGDVVVTEEADKIIITHYDGGSLIVTGTGCCIETFKEGNTVYISGSCTPLTGNWGEYPTETGSTSFDQSNLAKDFYNITGADGKSACKNYLELYSITGTGCTTTYTESIDGQEYIVVSGDCIVPEGGTSCSLLAGPAESMEWIDAEEMILDCLGLQWLTGIQVCTGTGQIFTGDFLVKPSVV